jgi:hypothetical protein
MECCRRFTVLKDRSSAWMGIFHREVTFPAFIKASMFATLQPETPNCPSEAY